MAARGNHICKFVRMPKLKPTYMKNQRRAQCTEEAEREVGGGCTNIMMTEKLWSGRNDRRHYSCSICEMEKWPPDKWPRLLAVQWLAHHHMYVLSDTGQYGKFQVEHSNKLTNMVTSGGRFPLSLLRCGICGFFFILFFRSKVIMKKLWNDTSFFHSNYDVFTSNSW